MLLVDNSTDLASAQNAWLSSACALFARASEGTAIVFTLLISDCEATAIVRDAHVDLLRIDLATPEGFQCRVNFFEIGVRFDLGFQARGACVPRPV